MIKKLKHIFAKFESLEGILFYILAAIAFFHPKFLLTSVIAYLLIKGSYLLFHDPIKKELVKNKYLQEVLTPIPEKTDVKPS